MQCGSSRRVHLSFLGTANQGSTDVDLKESRASIRMIAF